MSEETEFPQALQLLWEARGALDPQRTSTEALLRRLDQFLTRDGEDHVYLTAELKDRITGFKGTATGVTEFITGCRQFLVQPMVKEDGTFVDARWIDEDRLEVVFAPRLAVTTMPSRRLGGESPPASDGAREAR